MKCELHSGFKTTFGDTEYDTCFNNAKFIVSYKSPQSGKFVKKRVCGVHKISIEKCCKRVNKRIGEDYSQFKFEKVVDLVPK
jgi:hypothetical protein